ncbi:hypothetical protein KQI65_13810 [bacterium]|nr:hypothetical protein [bacterium]
MQQQSETAPPAAWEKPFALLSYLTPDTIAPLPAPRLRWVLYDSTIREVSIWYQKDALPRWNYIETVPAALPYYDVPVDLADISSVRFAVTRVNGKERDSSAVLTVDKQQVYLLEPVDGMLYLRSDSLRIHWRPLVDGIEKVQIEIATEGKDDWHHALMLTRADTVYTWVRPPFYAGGCNKMRISAQYWNTWSTVEELKFASFNVDHPREGDVLYRFLPASIEDEIIIPDCMTPAESTQYALSTDGGVSWNDVEKEWVVMAEATTSAMLRVTQPTLGMTATTGPFTIEDRSATYFALQKGMELRYMRADVKVGLHLPSDTVLTQWLTVHIDDEIVRNGRTEYPCTVTVRDGNGTSTTSTQLLWQERSGQQLIKGDFEPFSLGEIFGIHDASIDEFSNNLVIQQTPTSTTTRRYRTERGRGLVSAAHTVVTGHITPTSQSRTYQLLD